MFLYWVYLQLGHVITAIDPKLPYGDHGGYVDYAWAPFSIRVALIYLYSTQGDQPTLTKALYFRQYRVIYKQDKNLPFGVCMAAICLNTTMVLFMQIRAWEPRSIQLNYRTWYPVSRTGVPPPSRRHITSAACCGLSLYRKISNTLPKPESNPWIMPQIYVQT